MDGNIRQCTNTHTWINRRRRRRRRKTLMNIENYNAIFSHLISLSQHFPLSRRRHTKKKHRSESINSRSSLNELKKKPLVSVSLCIYMRVRRKSCNARHFCISMHFCCCKRVFVLAPTPNRTAKSRKIHLSMYAPRMCVGCWGVGGNESKFLLSFFGQS